MTARWLHCTALHIGICRRSSTVCLVVLQSQISIVIWDVGRQVAGVLRAGGIGKGQHDCQVGHPSSPEAYKLYKLYIRFEHGASGSDYGTGRVEYWTMSSCVVIVTLGMRIMRHGRTTCNGRHAATGARMRSYNGIQKILEDRRRNHNNTVPIQWPRGHMDNGGATVACLQVDTHLHDHSSSTVPHEIPRLIIR